MGHMSRLRHPSPRCAALLLGFAVLPLIACLGPHLVAQPAARGEKQIRPRSLPDKRLQVAVHPGLDLGRVVFKILDDSRAEGRGDGLAGGTIDVTGINMILKAHGVRAVEPVFATAPSELSRLRRLAEGIAGESLPDLSQYFFAHVARPADAPSLAGALRAHPAVENAYIPPIPEPAGDIGTPTPSFIPVQGYRSAPPVGLGVDAIAGQPGDLGAGVTIVDIEYDWNLAHEDLSLHGPTALLGGPPVIPAGVDPSGARNHGTAVLGILGADADAPGIAGIAPSSDLRVRSAAPAGIPNVAGAIMDVVSAFAGDIIVLPLQVSGPNTALAPSCPGGYFGSLPVEYYDAEYAAIRFATALGIHVVQAAGNGSQDLDASSPPLGHPSYGIFQPGSPTWRDSGAILVGAVTWTASHLPTCSTNRGTRLDTAAPGECVVTLGYGDISSVASLSCFAFAQNWAHPDPNQHYTASFGGTSAAAAIVAGAAALLAASHAARHDVDYSPSALRDHLRTTGSPSSDPTFAAMQPDLPASYTLLTTHAQLARAHRLPISPLTNDSQTTAIAADTTGDGVPEIIALTYYSGPGIPDAPRLDVFSDISTTPLYTLTPQGNYWILKPAGDVDGDGCADFILAKTSSPVATWVHSGATGNLIHYFADPVWSVAGGHDVNGDAIPDIAIAYLGQSFASPGYLRVFSGADGSTVFSVPAPPDSISNAFGQSLDLIGDLTGDGRPELIVGAPYTPSFYVNNTGVAHIYSGTGALLATFSAPTSPSYSSSSFGHAVLGCGDVDGDAVPDYAVKRSTSNGQFLFVYSGAGGAVLWTGSGSAFGGLIASRHDHDGDGLSDVITQSWDAVRVYRGLDGALLDEVVAPPGVPFSGGAFGQADFDGNGRQDLLLSTSISANPQPLGARLLVYHSFEQRLRHTPSMSAALGESALFLLRAGPGRAFEPYMLLAGVSGSSPGTPLVSGQVLPLNLDGVTTLLLSSPAVPSIYDAARFTGFLDGEGHASAILDLDPAVHQILAGYSLDFAAVAGSFPPPFFLSNPVAVSIVP